MTTPVFRSGSGAIRASVLDDLLITIMTGDAVSDVEFDEYLQWGQQQTVRVSLFWGQDTQLTAVQRNRASKVLKSRRIAVRSAILTDSKLMQGIATALSWVVELDYGAFPPSQLEPALSWLQRSAPIDLDRARRVFHELLDESKA